VPDSNEIVIREGGGAAVAGRSGLSAAGRMRHADGYEIVI
jgi:hypothetical protein